MGVDDMERGGGFVPAGIDIAALRDTGLHPDFWYPIARTKDVHAGKAHGVTFGGEPIVLIRPKEGAVFALEDRCAHRQVPLRCGVVNGDRVQCGYHGWAYDRSGKCVSVPYLSADKTLPNGVKSYPCRERYGLIWVFPGAREKAETVPFPDISSAENHAYKTRYLNRRVDCHYSFMHENLMDMNHQFLHRRLMGRIKTIFLGCDQGDDWMEARYSFTRSGGNQHWGERFIINRGGSAPIPEGERDLMVIRTEYPYQTLKFWTAGSDEPALDLWNCYIPIDKEQRVNHTYGLMMIRKPSQGWMINLFWPIICWFTDGIFREDRWIVELEQAAFDAQGEDWNNEIFPAIRGLKSVLTANGQPISAASTTVKAEQTLTEEATNHTRIAS